MLVKKLFFLVLGRVFLLLGNAEKAMANPDNNDELQRCLSTTLKMQRRLVESKLKLAQLDAKEELIKTLQNTVKQLEKDLKSRDESSEFCRKVAMPKKEEKPTLKRKSKRINQQSSTSCLSHGYSEVNQTIQLTGAPAFTVSCDDKTAGPGWTLIQQRIDGSLDFYKTWKEYRDGFGDIKGEHFIGLQNLYLLTNYAQQELYIQLTSFNDEIFYARYSHFVIGNELEKYKLKKLGKMDGNLANKFFDHLGHKFSTHDQDNDNSTSTNMAVKFHGGWWFFESNTRYGCNLNGKYVVGDSSDPHRLHWQWNNYKGVKMLIKPKSECSI